MDAQPLEQAAQAPAATPEQQPLQEAPEERHDAPSFEQIAAVQALVERCMSLYMTCEETAQVLEAQANISRTFTRLVWRQLEAANPAFFTAYAMRLQVKNQVLLFNHLLDQQQQAAQQLQQQQQAQQLLLQQQQRQQALAQAQAMQAPQQAALAADEGTHLLSQAQQLSWQQQFQAHFEQHLQQHLLAAAMPAAAGLAVPPWGFPLVPPPGLPSYAAFLPGAPGCWPPGVAAGPGATGTGTAPSTGPRPAAATVSTEGTPRRAGQGSNCQGFAGSHLLAAHWAIAAATSGGVSQAADAMQALARQGSLFSQGSQGGALVGTPQAGEGLQGFAQPHSAAAAVQQHQQLQQQQAQQAQAQQQQEQQQQQQQQQHEVVQAGSAELKRPFSMRDLDKLELPRPSELEEYGAADATGADGEVAEADMICADMLAE